MKKMFKLLYLHASKIVQSKISLLSVIIFSSFRYAIRVKKLSKETPTRDCLIIGNGPSLKQILANYTSELSKFDLLSVNMFCSSDYFTFLKPRYYVLTDPAFFEDAKESRIQKIQSDFVSCFTKVDWNIILFIPVGLPKKSKIIKSVNKNQNVQIYYYNMTPISAYLGLEHWLYKKNLGMPLAMNVLCASIFLMINIGYKRIYLIGSDHNWVDSFFVDDENRLMLCDRHFYGDTSVVNNETIDVWFSQMSKCFKSHRKINEYAQLSGCKVINAIQHSYIDAYIRDYIFDKTEGKR